MSDQPPVGTIHDRPQPRDAIHFALACVEVTERLRPGASVRLVQGTNDKVRGTTSPNEERTGIIDPFLQTDYVYPGQLVYMFLNPGTITTLRHDWTHPEFGTSETTREASQRWMRAFADEVDMTYKTLMDHARSFISSDGEEYATLGFDTPQIAYDMETFWKHYEIITGEKVELSDEIINRGMFSCAC